MEQARRPGLPASLQQRPTRRLSDKLAIAFDQACDQDEHAIAEQLLVLLERLLHRPHLGSEPDRRAELDRLVASHQRLWHLRRPKH